MSSQRDPVAAGPPHGPGAVPAQRTPTGPAIPVGSVAAPGGAVDHLDDDVTVILLSLAARKRAGPFAPLLRRIERSDGPGWFLDAIVEGCRAAGVSTAALSDPVGGPAALKRLKAWSKSTLAPFAESSALATTEPDADEATLRALVAYAVAVGVGLAVHDLRLSTRPPKEWDPLFVDLSEMVPMPWAETFRRAAGR